MTNVVQVPQWRPRHFTSAEAMLDAMRQQGKDDSRTNRQLAKEVGVSGGTISNFKSGKTRWPRPTTLFPLLKALNLELQIVPRR